MTPEKSTSTGEQPVRKRRRSDNPLSAARGKKKAESLWHRKSGAGFSLFVEFYGRQPDGVVACYNKTSGIKTSAREVSVSHVSITITASSVKSGEGLSRATKRRKKKKGKGSTNTATEPAPAPQQQQQQQQDTPVSNDAEEAPSDNRLLSALTKRDDSLRNKAPFRFFLTALSKPLPLTFRLRQGLPSQVEKTVHQGIASFDSLVAPVSFDKFTFQAKNSFLSKARVGQESPALKEFLVAESGKGTLARQELGSTLPVLALCKGGWMKSGSRVLDMCASPGSKTLQALEIVGETGRVKANDVNESRLTALKDAVGRSGVPQIDRIKYTMHDASKYPLPKRLFDVIICDVPCSGDGTIRKDGHILPNWTPNTSTKLHALQVSILKRAIQVVKIGGVVSYSTCSLNPVEDEAVVCAALDEFQKVKSGPSFVLEKWPVVEGFRLRPGVTQWKIADYVGDSDVEDEPSLRWQASFADATKQHMVDACPSMWCPNETPLRLQRCMRLHPQDHNSGGFFVALLRRTR